MKAKGGWEATPEVAYLLDREGSKHNSLGSF